MKMLDDLKQRFVTSRESLGKDLTAGLITGVAAIPDAMASALLAGINPLTGLYTMMVATPVGALFTSSQMMHISTTGALSLALNSDADWRPFKIEGYLFIALIYFVFCFSMSRYSIWVEKQVNKGKQR